MAAILLASMLCFSVLQTRPVVHEILIALFVTLTTPVTLILLARAAIYRDRSENAAQVPDAQGAKAERSEEHTSELQSLMRISYAVFCLKKKKAQNIK